MFIFVRLVVHFSRIKLCLLQPNLLQMQKFCFEAQLCQLLSSDELGVRIFLYQGAVAEEKHPVISTPQSAWHVFLHSQSGAVFPLVIVEGFDRYLSDVQMFASPPESWMSPLRLNQQLNLSHRWLRFSSSSTDHSATVLSNHVRCVCSLVNQ